MIYSSYLMKNIFFALTISLFIFFSSPVHADGGTTIEIVCTPVYGMANTCQEHITVDTGLENQIFYTLSTLSYLTGLGLFIKAKK